MKKKLPYLIAIFSLIFTYSFAQTTYYVSTSGDDTTGNGSSGSPWATIQKANDNAADGDTIQLADGTYTETSITTNKTLTIMGTSADGTIIQASDSQPAGDGSDDSPDLDIFKITGGKTVTFKNLTMQHGNTSNQNGGAIFANYNSSVVIENCNFFHNYSNWHGGAVYGDGPSTIIRNSSFENNTAGGDGGAIGAYGEVASDPKQSFSMENSTLYNNHAGGKGGAIMFTAELEFSLINNTIAFNTTASDGRKGIYSNLNAVATTFTNNILWNAESGGVDYGIDNDDPFTSAIVNNNIISKCWLPDLQNGPNSITWESTPIAATTANIDFGTFQDNGNGISSLSISATSIAKDAGDVGTATTTDAHGNNRIGSPDIGAFEEQTVLATKSFELEKVSLGPNPSNGTITLENLNEPSFSLDVYGVNGAVLYATKQTSNKIQIPQNIKGLIFIKVSTSNSSKVFKHYIQ